MTNIRTFLTLKNQAVKEEVFMTIILPVQDMPIIRGFDEVSP
jgi:hypothetical protein